jgi:chitin disaccharide deacetylase
LQHNVKVIINADDLGYNQQVNESVFDLISKGSVTSASLLVNGSAYEDAIRCSRDFLYCSFGVHLNITEGLPLTNNIDLRAILKPDGTFDGDKIRRIVIKEPLRKAILKEWTAQVEKVLKSGILVSHFDSHHHIHTVPGLFATLKQLQKRFRIRRVRITMNIYPQDNTVPLSKLVMKKLWNFGLRNCYRTQTTEGFTSLEIFTEAVGLNLHFNSIELMVHPGLVNYEMETRLLSDEWWRSLPVEIQKINYNDL